MPRFKKKIPYQEKMLATNERLLMMLIKGAKRTDHKIKLESNINMLKPVR